MDDIKLVKPHIFYAKDIMAFKHEIIAANDKDAFAGCGSLRRYNSAEEWIHFLNNLENIETCPKGYVPASTYLATRSSDNKIIGITDLRHHINHPIFGVWGGHIGYSVRPSERNKGYGKTILKQVLKKCQEKNINRVMITCRPENFSSAKMILSVGGIFEKNIEVDGIKISRYWIEL